MGIWDNMVNGYKDTEEYGFFKRIKDTWKRANSEQRKEIVWKTARNVALFAGSLVAGSMVGGPVGVASVVVGWGVYGANKEYQARKQAAMHKAIKQNKGHDLTEKQKSNVKLKALADTLDMGSATLGSATLGMATLVAEEDVREALNKTAKKLGRNKPKVAEPTQPAKPVSTKAFDFDFMKSQGGRKL